MERRMKSGRFRWCGNKVSERINEIPESVVVDLNAFLYYSFIHLFIYSFIHVWLTYRLKTSKNCNSFPKHHYYKQTLKSFHYLCSYSSIF